MQEGVSPAQNLQRVTGNQQVCHGCYHGGPCRAQSVEAWPARRLQPPPNPQSADADGSGELDIEEFASKLGPHLGANLSKQQVRRWARRAVALDLVEQASQNGFVSATCLLSDLVHLKAAPHGSMSRQMGSI